MKVTDQGLTGYVTIMLPIDEADLLYRATDGYVALARTLAAEVRCRFPEGEAEVSRKLHGIHGALHASIARHKAATRVWEGSAEAVGVDELARLRAAAERMWALEKEAEKAPPMHVVALSPGGEPIACSRTIDDFTSVSSGSHLAVVGADCLVCARAKAAKG